MRKFGQLFRSQYQLSPLSFLGSHTSHPKKDIGSPERSELAEQSGLGHLVDREVREGLQQSAAHCEKPDPCGHAQKQHNN